jgi:micrococcal nuclease
MYEYKLKNIRIIDGDTIEGDLHLGFGIVWKKQQIRLYGIDTPESRTSDKVEKIFGIAAKERLSELIKKDCIIRTHKDEMGKFGRILGEPFTEDGNNICEILVQESYAVKYIGKDKDEIRLKHMMNRNTLMMEEKVDSTKVNEASKNEK